MIRVVYKHQGHASAPRISADYQGSIRDVTDGFYIDADGQVLGSYQEHKAMVWRWWIPPAQIIVIHNLEHPDFKKETE